MRIIEFIDRELAGFTHRLELAYRPPCKTGKSHKYKKDEKGNILDVCEKCGWSREKYQSLSKKEKEEIMTRMEVLRDVRKQHLPANNN